MLFIFHRFDKIQSQCLSNQIFRANLDQFVWKIPGKTVHGPVIIFGGHDNVKNCLDSSLQFFCEKSKNQRTKPFFEVVKFDDFH